VPYHPLVVRAIDVGYGHIKFSDGRDPANPAVIRTDSIPSQSPSVQPSLQTVGGVMKQRDTFIVPVEDRFFEVGHQVNLALSGNQETEVLDENFALGDAYAARLFGAINHMSLPEDIIDVLVLGLPLNTYSKHHAALAKRFTGTYIINTLDDKITIKRCYVYPQPLGSYMCHMLTRARGAEISGDPPLTLSIDPGYNTVDWFVCQGMSANEARSGSVPRGMSAVIRAIVDDMVKTYGFDTNRAEMIRSIDMSLSTGKPFTRYGRFIDLTQHLAAGNSVIQEAIQAIRNSVDSGADIDAIILTGGGASHYSKAVAEKFPHHEVVTLENPAHANVRGFHLIGEMLAKSLEQALKINQIMRSSSSTTVLTTPRPPP
jgi:plasmid segregation protein ParM